VIIYFNTLIYRIILKKFRGYCNFVKSVKEMVYTIFCWGGGGESLFPLGNLNTVHEDLKLYEFSAST